MTKREIGEQLKQWRISAGLTQQQLAEKMGMEFGQAVYNWEAGKCFVPVRSASKFCRAVRIKNESIINLGLERARLRFSRYL
jgi:transcriptional regulator with XRE-family HTH domain